MVHNTCGHGGKNRFLGVFRFPCETITLLRAAFINNTSSQKHENHDRRYT